MGHFRPLSTLVLAALLGVPLPIGCGARTGLQSPDVCYTEGELRNCSNTCGTGTQVCTDERWQDCQVAPTELECTNDCGEGLAHCEDDTLGECVVEEVSEACTNDCGDGTRWCRDDRWGECEVEPVVEDCVNDCGDGILTCENGAWSECVVPRLETTCASVCGEGTQSCENGIWDACTAPQPLPPKLDALIRDFKIDHPDFERYDLVGSYYDTGIVESELDAAGLPVYAHVGPTDTVTSKATFDQWFRDVEGVNLSTETALQLNSSPTAAGMFEYVNTSFFPIDNQLFGNEGLSHNYHFTLMVATSFTYVGGEVFSFEGDDDMWVFVNRKLAIDLGGVHESLIAEVDLDEEAGVLDIETGNTYDLHLFFAERKTIASDFTIRTTIADVGSCP